MSNIILQAKENTESKPHPEGIHPAVCEDVIDLGMVDTEFQGEKRRVPKVRVVFSTDQKQEDGRACLISKTFTASLHPKAKLAEFLGKWRGRPVLPGETVDLGKLIGACCTLVISHQQNLAGRTYAAVDAVSKPTRKVARAADYDPAAMRQRIAEWNAKGAQPAPNAPAAPASRPAAQPAAPASKSAAPATAQPGPSRTGGEDNVPFDPEVGF